RPARRARRCRSSAVMVRRRAFPPRRPNLAKSIFRNAATLSSIPRFVRIDDYSLCSYNELPDLNMERTEQYMRVGIYVRVSTQDKDQNPETQLLPLREFAAVQGWSVAGEFVDQASATDLRGRRAWRALLDLASKRRIDVILVWKLDRAF